MKQRRLVIFTVFIIFSIMLTLFTVNVSASTNTTKDLIIGDVNGDGKTDSIDITEIKNYLLGIIKVLVIYMV